jgi:hypothetical protein
VSNEVRHNCGRLTTVISLPDRVMAPVFDVSTANQKRGHLVPPVSFKNQIIRVLKQIPFNEATFPQLIEALSPRMTEQQIVATIDRLDLDPDTGVSKVRRGVQYFGTETGKRPGLYKEVKRGIERRWAKDNKLGSSFDATHTSHQGRKGAGSWTHPDLVLRVQRRSDAKPQVHYHAFEIEHTSGFDIKSVYQAFEQGRGADFRWVFFTGSMPAETNVPWLRIRAAAQEIGVGLVHVVRLKAPAGWKTIEKARIVTAPPSAAQREAFFRSCGIASELAPLGPAA